MHRLLSDTWWEHAGYRLALKVLVLRFETKFEICLSIHAVFWICSNLIYSNRAFTHTHTSRTHTVSHAHMHSHTSANTGARTRLARAHTVARTNLAHTHSRTHAQVSHAHTHGHTRARAHTRFVVTHLRWLAKCERSTDICLWPEKDTRRSDIDILWGSIA
jgi:hypothetical protein